MKVSSSVGRWKSFVDKLHPQVPLTGQESHRLLTALTSSFRRHLDEAHPTLPAEEERKARLVDVGVAKPQTRTWQSSASHADKHLASVLTNPLFVKGGRRLDYTSAKIALAKDPSKDPIELLEEYHQQHAATVPIADLCLRTFMDRLRVLTPEQRLKHIQDVEPGRRTFLWLLQSGFYNSGHNADNLEFQDFLVYFLTKEGREHNIWEWIKLDTQVSESASVDLTSRINRSDRKFLLHAYRWRGRLLHALMIAKLGLEVDERTTSVTDATKINHALEALLKACDIKASASRRDHIYWMPLIAAYTRLVKELKGPSYQVKHGLDVDNFERLISYLPLIFEGEPTIFLKSDMAKLRLIHPHKPSAREAHEFLQDLFGDNPSIDAGVMLPYWTNPRRISSASNSSAFVARVVAVLRAQGQDEDASWVASTVRDRCPQIGHFLVRDIESFSRVDHTARRSEEQEQQHDESRVPFPTFV